MATVPAQPSCLACRSEHCATRSTSILLKASTSRPAPSQGRHERTARWSCHGFHNRDTAAAEKSDSWRRCRVGVVRPVPALDPNPADSDVPAGYGSGTVIYRLDIDSTDLAFA